MVGKVIYFAGAGSIPPGFLACDGAELSTTTYAALFAVIGYAFGGSGSTFRVPDLRSMFVRATANGSSNDPYRTTRQTPYAGGASGDAVGSKQYSDFSHSHAMGVGSRENKTSSGTQTSSGNETSARSYTDTYDAHPSNIHSRPLIRYI